MKLSLITENSFECGKNMFEPAHDQMFMNYYAVLIKYM